MFLCLYIDKEALTYGDSASENWNESMFVVPGYTQKVRRREKR